MAKTFASQGDLKPKKISFQKLSSNCYAFTTEGDPNTGVIVGDDGVMVIDAQATPLMAREVIRRIRGVTSKPIRYVVLTHYHAVRVLGASAYGAGHIIASEATRELIRERAAQDMKSEIGRFPRLTGSTRSTSTACLSTSRAPMTRRAASSTRAFGPRAATSRCGSRSPKKTGQPL
jgi:glyoxylase-like metal-dependent hydrolase (beta-lactamase superfamily II)